MKIHYVALLATVSLFAACGQSSTDAKPELSATPDAEESASQALHDLFAAHFERQLQMNPTMASSIGDNRFNDQLANNHSPEYRAAEEALDTEFLERLHAIDRDALGYQDQLSYDMFRINRETSLEGNQFPFHLQPINQFYSITSYFVQLGSGSSDHPFKTVKDYDDFLSRADGFSRNIDQIIENMKIGMQQGVTQPKILMAKLVPQLDSQIVEDVTQSAFYAPVREMPEEFSDADRKRLTAAYEDKISNTIIPAYQRLSNFVGDEYLSAARDTVGLYAQPNGEEWYAYMVRTRTTTDMTPDEIHQIGLDEVARIQEEMRGVMEAVGFEGDLADFFDFVNTDEQFFYDEPDQMMTFLQTTF